MKTTTQKKAAVALSEKDEKQGGVKEKKATSPTTFTETRL
jgi:hypothetical protein